MFRTKQRYSIKYLKNDPVTRLSPNCSSSFSLSSIRQRGLALAAASPLSGRVVDSPGAKQSSVSSLLFMQTALILAVGSGDSQPNTCAPRLPGLRTDIYQSADTPDTDTGLQPVIVCVVFAR